MTVLRRSANANKSKLFFKQREDASYDFTINRTIDTLYSPGRYVAI